MYQKYLKKFEKVKFENDLITWYYEEKRDLPWRRTKDPYKIWISEIMLQQTRVDTVISYYENFLEKFPTVEDLAKAEVEDVLKAWEGLGYYSRAKNLHKAANEIVQNFNSTIPSDAKLLRNLKGIGPYTSGAIASIAFGKKEPAVDGNVMRVLSRLLKIEKEINVSSNRKVFEEIVNNIMTTKDPSAFNQGLMELGAVVCTPKNPTCLLCPVQSHCKAFYEGVQDLLPKRKKAKKKKIKEYNLFLIKDKYNRIFIEKREKSGLLANLWQFPMIKKCNQTDLDQLFLEKYEFPIFITKRIKSYRHIFTHLIWKIDVFEANCIDLNIEKIKNGHFVSLDDLNKYPFATAHKKAMEDNK